MDAKDSDYLVEEQQTLQLKQPSSGKSRNPRETRVLLVTIQSNVGNRTLQHSDIYAPFSKHGEVQRILIFKATDPQAIFVEMDTIENARSARKYLNNSQIYSDGTRINVLVSNKQRIDFQDKNPAGIDYTILKQRIIEKQINTETDMIVNSIFEEKSDSALNSSDIHLIDTSKQQTGTATSSSSKSVASDGNAYSGVSTGSSNSNAASQQKQLSYPNQSSSSPSNKFSYPQSALFSLIPPVQLLNNSNLTYGSDFSNQSARLNYQHQVLSQEYINSNQQKYQQIQFQPHPQQNLQNQHQTAQQAWGNQKDMSKSSSGVSSSSSSSAHSQKLKGLSTMQHGSGNEADEEFKTDDSNSLEHIQNRSNNNSNNVNVNSSSSSKDSHTAQKNYESLLNSLEELNLEHSIYSKVDRSIDAKQALPFALQTPQSYLRPQDPSIHQQPLMPYQTTPQFLSESSNTFFSSLPKPTPIIQKQLVSSAPNNLQTFQQQQQQQQQQSQNDDEIYSSVDETTNPLEFLHPQYSKATKKSKVIYANRFEPAKTTLIQIFNLFSAFGNIHKIIFLKAKAAVLIEYDNEQHASFAKDYLTDRIFNGNCIKIYFSHHEGIFFNEGAEKPPDEEYFEVSEKMHRFKADTITPINPPIDTLHLSNIRRDSCSFEIIKKLFDPFAKIKNYKPMLEQNNKNMCLLKFDNASVAMWALANTHGVMLNNRQLKVSFSKKTLE